MSREPLKSGDRVAVYGASGRYTARIVCLTGDGFVNLIDMPRQERGRLVHLKQCRRLVKRKRREIWVPAAAVSVLDSGGHVMGITLTPGDNFSNGRQGVRFVEAPRKKHYLGRKDCVCPTCAHQ